MGRGDKKTKRGKTNIGSFGKSRPKKIKVLYKKPVEPKTERQG